MGAERGISLASATTYLVSRYHLMAGVGAELADGGTWPRVAKARGFFSASLTQALRPAPPAWLVAKVLASPRWTAEAAVPT